MADQSDAAAWAALVVAAFAMIIATGQVAQQYASSGQLIRLCDSVVYGGKSGLPGRGRRVWSWSQFRFRVLYDVPMFRLPRGKGNLWDTAPLSSVRFTEEVDIVANEKYWSRLEEKHRVGEAAWVSFCRQIKDTCEDRVLITLKHDDADRVPPELPNIPVPVSLRDVVLMALTIGLDCTEGSYSRRSLTMQGEAGVITSSNHPILGLVIHFTPQAQTLQHPRPTNWRHWCARALGGVPVGDHVMAWNGKHSLVYFESADSVLCDVLLHLQDRSKDDVLGSAIFQRPSPRKAGTWAVSKTDHLGEQSARSGQRPTDATAEVSANVTGMVQEEDARFINIRSYTGSSFRRQDSGFAALEPVVASKGQCSDLKWYWISQMNAFDGHFASPWRDVIDHTICARAFGIVLRILVFDESVGLSAVRFPGSNITEYYKNSTPFFSQPPYAVYCPMSNDPVLTGKSPRAKLPPLPGWPWYESFGCHLPEIAILGDNFFTIDEFDKSFGYNSILDTTYCMHELMRFDHWLSRAAESGAIVTGKTQLLKTTPALVHYLLEHHYEDFKYRYVTGHGGRECAESMIAMMVHLGLSAAEITFVTVAMLRTLRYAFCLGSGLNTKPVLQIMWNDMAAHMV